MTQNSYPKPPFPDQQQDRQPGLTAPMDPQPDHGEKTYRGSGRLAGKVALITGADSGIGRAVAIAYAREGADVAIAYLNEDEDAKETARWVEEAGRRSRLLPGDLTDRAHCRDLVAKTVAEFGRIDIIVNNAAYQMSYDGLEDISDDEWDKTFSTNIGAMFRIVKAALPHMSAGQRDREYEFGQRRCAESRPHRLRDHQGRDPELHRRARATARGEGHPRELRRTGADLDAADPVDDAAREGEELRLAGAHEARGPAGRTRRRLRDAGLRRIELHVGRDHRGDGWQADHIEPRCAASWLPSALSGNRRLADTGIRAYLSLFLGIFFPDLRAWFKAIAAACFCGLPSSFRS